MVDDQTDQAAGDLGTGPGSAAPTAVDGPGGAVGTAPEGAVGAEHLCPWCSADLGDGEVDRCPSCGAVLTGDPDVSVPGVTTLDEEVARIAERRPTTPKRTFFSLLITRDPQIEESGVLPSSGEALDPPSAEVRREMRRLRAELDEAAAAELAHVEAPDPGLDIGHGEQPATPVERGREPATYPGTGDDPGRAGSV